MEKRLINIPFAGFYNTAHESFIDDCINDIFCDRETGGILDHPENFDPDYSAIFKAYAQEYVKTFEHWLKQDCGIDISLEFESLQSPKFYNYETDKIYAYICPKDVQALRDFTNEKDLRDTARERHTSRSGFISFYDPDIDTWGDIQEWDNIQLETLLLAAIKTSLDDPEGFNSISTWDLMEDDRCNGVIDSLVWGHMGQSARDIANTWHEQNEKENG